MVNLFFFVSSWNDLPFICKIDVWSTETFSLKPTVEGRNPKFVICTSYTLHFDEFCGQTELQIFEEITYLEV